MKNTDPGESMHESRALELTSHQASLAFERTMMTTDQTLMSVIQTSLSLIGFGFAMVLFFHQIGGEFGVDLRAPARNFGISLVTMGVGLVAVGLIEHHQRFANLRAATEDLQRRELLMQGLVHRRSSVAALALLLLLTGLLVMLGILVRIGPFG